MTLFSTFKVGCVEMVIWSELRMRKYRDGDYPEDAPHFTSKNLTWYFLCLVPNRFKTFPHVLQTLLLHILSRLRDRLNLRLSICFDFTHWQFKKVHIYSSHIGILKFIPFRKFRKDLKFFSRFFEIFSSLKWSILSECLCEYDFLSW